MYKEDWYLVNLEASAGNIEYGCYRYNHNLKPLDLHIWRLLNRKNPLRKDFWKLRL